MTREDMKAERFMGVAAGPYQVFMLALCVWALLMLVVGTTLQIDPSIRVILCRRGESDAGSGSENGPSVNLTPR